MTGYSPVPDVLGIGFGVDNQWVFLVLAKDIFKCNLAILKIGTIFAIEFHLGQQASFNIFIVFLIMNDSQVRYAFHTSILEEAHLCNETIILNELGLKNGESRADIAVFNGKMIGYEIKTEKDNLSRLTSQVKNYSQVFDKAFIIVAEKHVQEAKKIIPNWWGIYLIESANETYSFYNTRKAKINPSQDSFSIAQLLWKAEALEVANTFFKCNLKNNMNRQEIYEIISSKCRPKRLSKIVMAYLKKREGWRK